MPIQAQLHDGRILEFPDGTNPQVIQATVKKVLGLAPSTERTWGEAAGDIGAAAVKGFGQVLQFPGELVGLLPGLRGFGEAIATPGEYIAGAGERLKSQGLKAREALRSQALSEAEKEGVLAEFATAITETIKDPALISTFLTEQVPQLLGPGAAIKLTRMLGKGAVEATAAGAAREAAEKALRERAAAAAVGTGVAMQGADVGNDTYKAVYELATKQGMPEAEARALALEKARIAALEAGAISLATARLPGGSAIERRMAGLPGGSRVGAGLREAATESLEEAGGAGAKGVAMAEVDPSISPLTGVGTAAGFGALGGFGLGTVVGGAPVNAPRAEPPAPIDVARQEAAKKEAERAAKAAAAAPPTPTTAPAPPTTTTAAPGAPAAPSNVLDDAAVRALGFVPGKGKRRTFYDKLVNKDLSDPKDLETVRSMLGNFVEKARNQGPELKGAALKASQFLETLPPKAAPTPSEAPKPSEAAVTPPTGTEATTPTVEAEGAPEKPTVSIEPPVPAGFIRVYHSGSRGEGDFGRWVSTNRTYASDYRSDLPLFYVDLPETDPRVNNPDYPDEQGVKQGFTFNFQLTPQEATTLKEIQRTTPTETPRATSIPTEPGSTGAGVSVAGGSPAVSTAQGTGAVEPVRVVPPVENAGRPAAGEGQQSAAVTPAPKPATVSFRTPDSGIVYNESVSGALRRITEDDDIALEFPAREGAVMLTGIDRQAGGQKGRASDVLKALTGWADKNNERLVLMPSASGDLKQPELIKWYERNGFTQAPDGAMERAPKKKAPAPVALAPAPTPAAPAPKPAKSAEPEYTEEDIDRAVEAGLFTEEQAQPYREALRGEEAPQTAMGLAFERQIADITAQMDALKQKNGRAPAPKSKNRAKYDELKAQLDALVTPEKGDLVARLKKIEASGVVGVRGERPVIDLDAVKSNLLKARAEPGMYQAVLTYIGVDADGNYLPTTYSREEAAELAGLKRGSGANVSRVAQAMGIDAEAVSRFHAGQTDIIVRGKDVSEAGTGATDLQPSRGVLYEAPKKNKRGKAAGFLRDALTETGTLDFSKLDDKQIADIYARASNYDPSKGTNRSVIQQLNTEIAERTKKDRKSMQSALDRAYRVVRAEEEAKQEEAAGGPETAAPDQQVSEDEEFEASETTDTTRRLSDEEVDEDRYRSVPQAPADADRISEKDLNKIVNDIEKALGGKLDITIADDVADVDSSQVPGSRAGGVIGGKIYLFRSGIIEGIEGQKTIFHEVFHKGLRNLLPSAEYAALMTKLYNQSAAVRQAADAYLASEAGKKDTEELSPEDARILAVNEALADMAEETDLNGSMLRQLGNFFARLADRFGMPTLARAIRTMGLNPLQVFIRDAIQAGIQPSTGTTETRFRTVTPQTEAAVAGVEVIGEKPEKSLADTLKRYQPLAIRMKAADSLAPIDDVFTKGYAGKVRDALGNLNPMVLISRALDHARISLEALRTGSIAVKDGIVQAVELTIPEDSQEFGLIAGKTVNYQRDVIGRIASEAKEAGQSYTEYRKNIDTVLYAHREYNLREHNRQVEAQAQALEAAGKKDEADKLRKDQIIELFIKDEAKLDELEAEFQRNIGIQEIGQVLDAIRFKALDTLVETNRLTPEQAQEYKDNIGYIPFDRIVEYEKAFNETRGKNRGIAALKNRKDIEGSGRQTTSVIENFSRLMDWATQESMKNQASLAALKDMVLLKLATRGANNTTGATGANITIYEKGVPTTFHVPDPAHVVALSLQEHQLSSVFKALQKASQILRAGVTSLPPFAIKQIFDDISRAYAYSGVEQPLKLVGRILFNFPATWVREVFGMRHNATIRLMARLGIIGSYDIGTQGNLKDILQEAGAEKRSIGRVMLRVMEAGAKASDIAVRQAIFDQVLAETGDVAAAESRAREIINFSRKGSSKFMATMISVVPFFNAYARGMDKLAVAAAGKVVGQSTGQARAMFYKRMGYLTAMGLTYALMMSDDEEYQKLPDHVRDTNWILPYGKELGFIPAIPIPGELAFFFKAISERVVRYYKLQGTPEEQLAVEVLGNLAKRGVDVFSSPNLLAQGFRPFLENISNYSWFLGRPLESQGQLALDPFQRYGVGTSDLMKMTAEQLDVLGKETGIDLIRISPIKLENAIRGIFGTAAGVTLSIGDAIVNPTRTDRPLHQQMAAQLTGASALMKDPVGSRMIDEIYQLEKEVNQVNSTYNRLMEKDPAKVDDYLKRNVGLMSIRPAVTDLMKSIKSLDEEARLIDSTKEISGESRRELINQLKAQQNSLAKDVLALRTQARKTQQGL